MSTHQAEFVIPSLKMGDRLRVVRREYLGKISQQAMADLLGVPRERYSAWESGMSEPRTADARRIANVLQSETGVSAAWILGVNENGPTPSGGGTVTSFLSESNRRPFHYNAVTHLSERRAA